MIKKSIVFGIFLLITLQVIVAFGKALQPESQIELINIGLRMNDYPPSLYRLAHILEERKEFRLFYRTEKYFFDMWKLD